LSIQLHEISISGLIRKDLEFVHDKKSVLGVRADIHDEQTDPSASGCLLNEWLEQWVLEREPVRVVPGANMNLMLERVRRMSKSLCPTAEEFASDIRNLMAFTSVRRGNRKLHVASFNRVGRTLDDGRH
jgi:hypothetical protein